MTGKDSGQHISDTFEYVFSKYNVSFVAIASSYVFDRNVAQDIVTDVFVHLWERRSEIVWDDNIKGYLYMAVRARCISWLRSYQARQKAHDELGKIGSWRIESGIATLSDGDVSGRLFGEEVFSIYRRELEKMPRLTRDVFLSSRDDGCTYQEIADRYGIKVRKVTAEMQRALSILRKALKDYL